ncbi:MAG: VOC family protein [Leptospiraceae bacterium]|nr:VOC family protein [Leptospiraceae bacterium]
MIIVEGIDHVSIAVTNLSASAKFYSDLFDFEVLDDSNSKFTIMTLDPIKVKLVLVDKVENQLSGSLTPVLSFVLDVDDFTEAISEIEEKGIKIVKGPESAGKGEALVFKDPDNNLIEIFYQS